VQQHPGAVASTCNGGTDVVNATCAPSRALDTPLGGAGDAHRVWTLSPSDLTFLLASCARCFYLKMARRSPRPQAPFPRVFRSIDGAMKRRCAGARSEDLVPGAPPGAFCLVDRWVRSAPFRPVGSESACALRGRIDAAITGDDGGLVVVDFKTAEPKPSHAVFYARQLEAYAYALEHPAACASTVVTDTGLIVFSPEAFDVAGESASLSGPLRWQEVPRDPGGFEALLAEVVAMLEAPEPPAPTPGCSWCLGDSSFVSPV
jgi:PD-(D/E)XK nuclease superfamily protein